MKLLVVMSRFPWPPRTGGSLIAYNTLKELLKRHSISVICREHADDEGDLKGAFEEVRYAEDRTAGPRSILARLLQLVRGVPPFISYATSPQMQRLVAERAADFDAIVMFELMAIQYCPPEFRHNVVVNIEDPMSAKYDLYRRLPVFSRFQRFRLFVEARLLAMYERRELPPLGRVLLLSEADVELMRQQGGHTNLGHAIYATACRNADEVVGWAGRTPGTIVFSGNMFHGPNVDGALFFLREVFPIVVERAPSAVLWIVGANPDHRIVEAARHFGGKVMITGFVPDVAEYLAKACVSICPVRVRVGSQTKVLEAMAVGTPVVSTSAGNAGIRGTSGEHLWEADEPAVFAEKILALLAGEGWSQMSEEGRKLVRDKFNWQNSAAGLETYLLRLANHPSANPVPVPGMK